MSRTMRFCSSSVVASSQASRNASSLGAFGQPNQADAPLRMAICAGTNTLLKLVRLVMKMFQPPLSGGSLLARRATTMPHSSAW